MGLEAAQEAGTERFQNPICGEDWMNEQSNIASLILQAEAPFRFGQEVDLLQMAKKVDAETWRWYVDASRALRAQKKAK